MRFSLYIFNTVLLVVFFAGGGVYAQDLNSDLRHAQKFLGAGQYQKAYEEFLPFAEKGNPLAQFTIGLFYDYGWGKAQDKASACNWFEKAAEGDIPAANHLYGECVANGIGRPVDSAKALERYTRAAELGHYISWCSMAEFYMEGRGVEQDQLMAVQLCEKAAERDIPIAQMQTGLYYLRGGDKVQDYAKSAYWLHLAANKNIPEAQFNLGVILRDGLGVEKAPEQAKGWFEKAASLGYVDAYFPCGKLYFESEPDPHLGKLSEHDLAKAYLWLHAAEKGAIDPHEVEQSHKLLEEIRSIMPATWIPELDTKVAAHLETYSPE